MQAFVNVAGKPRAELKGYLSAPWGEADVAILDRDVGAVAQKSRPGITPCGLIRVALSSEKRPRHDGP